MSACAPVSHAPPGHRPLLARVPDFGARFGLCFELSIYELVDWECDRPSQAVVNAAQ